MSPNNSWRRLRRRAQMIAITACLMALTVLPADAKPLEKFDYSGEETFLECDGAFRVDGSFEGTITIKDANPSTDSQFFPFSDKFRARSVITNLETGRFITTHHQGLIKELQARHVGDGVFEFRSQNAGQPFVIADSSGRVVFRDRGLLVFSGVFDTLGDGMPGGDFLAFELVRIAGPHPLFGRDLCELAFELTS